MDINLINFYLAHKLLSIILLRTNRKYKITNISGKYVIRKKINMSVRIKYETKYKSLCKPVYQYSKRVISSVRYKCDYRPK